MDSVFEEEGWTPVSPRLAAMRRAVLATVVVVLTTLGAALAGLFAPAWTVALVLAAGTLILVGGWVWIRRNVASWGYTERDEDLLVRRGIAFRELVVVPYGRMQFVDVSQGPVQSRFDVATVQLHTAAAATDARIPGLAPVEAARLRDRLAARGEARTAGL